jgi:hypothetical protein
MIWHVPSKIRLLHLKRLKVSLSLIKLHMMSTLEHFTLDTIFSFNKYKPITEKSHMI